MKSQVQAFIDELREHQTLEPEKSLTSLDEDEQDEQGEQDEQDEQGELSDSETIKSQAEMIQAYASEIHFLKHKLDELNSLTSLEDAKKLANTCLKSKKGKWEEVARLLSGIYQTEVTIDDLK